MHDDEHRSGQVSGQACDQSTERLDAARGGFDRHDVVSDHMGFVQ
jgi:hypothetical protein